MHFYLYLMQAYSMFSKRGLNVEKFIFWHCLFPDLREITDKSPGSLQWPRYNIIAGICSGTQILHVSTLKSIHVSTLKSILVSTLESKHVVEHASCCIHMSHAAITFPWSQNLPSFINTLPSDYKWP